MAEISCPCRTGHRTRFIGARKTTVRAGAPEADWEPRLKETFGQHCAVCHLAMPSLVGLAQYAKVKKLTETGEGASLQTLTRVAHIHLFGISIIFPWV